MVLDLGLVLAGIALLVGSVTLIIHHRWIEIAVLTIGMPPIAADVFAPGMSGLILTGGVVLGVVIGAWDAWEGRRRERLDERHRQRRAAQIADSGEG